MVDNHVRKRRRVLFLGVVVGAQIFATLVIAAALISNSIGPMIWNSWSTHADRVAQEEARGTHIETEARKQTFQTLCPDYFEASFFDRLLSYRDRGWCESFRDRIPVQS